MVGWPCPRQSRPHKHGSCDTRRPRQRRQRVGNGGEGGDGGGDGGGGGEGGGEGGGDDRTIQPCDTMTCRRPHATSSHRRKGSPCPRS
ncbi:hypothetical protein GTY88_34815 [Streptomyces sp. SID5926]|nr:hypothetical protein [Streptomyces sp. SID5926]